MTRLLVLPQLTRHSAAHIPDSSAAGTLTPIGDTAYLEALWQAGDIQKPCELIPPGFRDEPCGKPAAWLMSIHRTCKHPPLTSQRYVCDDCKRAAVEGGGVEHKAPCSTIARVTWTEPLRK